MRLIFTFLILFITGFMFAQSNKDKDCLKKAKQIIISNSNENFFNKLYQFEIRHKKVSNCYFLDNDSIVKFKDNDSLIVITYLIVTDFYKEFDYRSYGGYSSIQTSNSIMICFDKNLRLIYMPNISEIFKGYNLFQTFSNIKRDEIKRLSDSLSETKKMKIRRIFGIYDFNSKQLYWEIIREKGFKKGLSETQRINFINKKLISVDRHNFQRRFGEALVETYYKTFE